MFQNKEKIPKIHHFGVSPLQKGSASQNNNHKRAIRAITHTNYIMLIIFCHFYAISIDLPGPEIINSTGKQYQ